MLHTHLHVALHRLSAAVLRSVSTNSRTVATETTVSVAHSPDVR